MAKEYRPYGLEQAYLLPPAPREWLPEGHLALFPPGRRGEPTGHRGDCRAVQERAWTPGIPSQDAPSLLLYGYCTGVYSSRKIEVYGL